MLTLLGSSLELGSWNLESNHLPPHPALRNGTSEVRSYEHAGMPLTPQVALQNFRNHPCNTEVRRNFRSSTLLGGFAEDLPKGMKG